MLVSPTSSPYGKRPSHIGKSTANRNGFLTIEKARELAEEKHFHDLQHRQKGERSTKITGRQPRGHRESGSWDKKDYRQERRRRRRDDSERESDKGKSEQESDKDKEIIRRRSDTEHESDKDRRRHRRKHTDEDEGGGDDKSRREHRRTSPSGEVRQEESTEDSSEKDHNHHHHHHRQNSWSRRHHGHSHDKEVTEVTLKETSEISLEVSRPIQPRSILKNRNNGAKDHGDSSDAQEPTSKDSSNPLNNTTKSVPYARQRPLSASHADDFYGSKVRGRENGPMKPRRELKWTPKAATPFVKSRRASTESVSNIASSEHISGEDDVQGSSDSGTEHVRKPIIKDRDPDVSRWNRGSRYPRFRYPQEHHYWQLPQRGLLEMKVPQCLRKFPQYTYQPLRHKCHYVPWGSVTYMKGHDVRSVALPHPENYTLKKRPSSAPAKVSSDSSPSHQVESSSHDTHDMQRRMEEVLNLSDLPSDDVPNNNNGTFYYSHGGEQTQSTTTVGGTSLTELHAQDFATEGVSPHSDGGEVQVRGYDEDEYEEDFDDAMPETSKPLDQRRTSVESDRVDSRRSSVNEPERRPSSSMRSSYSDIDHDRDGENIVAVHDEDDDVDSWGDDDSLPDTSRSIEHDNDDVGYRPTTSLGQRSSSRAGVVRRRSSTGGRYSPVAEVIDEDF